MKIKDTIINKIVDYRVNQAVGIRLSPSMAYINSKTTSDVNSAFSGNSIPRVGYKTVTDSAFVNDEMEKIVALNTAISESSLQIALDHYNAVQSYEDMYTRIKNVFHTFSSQVGELLNYSCYPIESKFSNQTANSYCGVIGNIITLPFYINSASMYNDIASLAISSTSEISFSNADMVSYIPLNTKPSIKVIDTTPTVQLSMALRVEETKANAFYIKFDNEIKEARFSFILNGKEQYAETRSTSEILLNFLPITFDSIQMVVTMNNLNTDKPTSVQISDIDIFKNILFAKKGSFESKPKKIRDFASANKVSMTYASQLDTSVSNVDQLLSVSTDDAITSFNKIDKDYEVNVSLFKYTYTSDMDTFTDKSAYGTAFNSVSISATDPMWSMDYKNSIILYGLNKDFLLDGASQERRFENWTLSGNYYVTTLLNYEENVSVNIGSKTCIINGKECTGIIRIPIGISSIQVHVKDIDLNIDPQNKATINDSINFAYVFSGLPAYQSDNAMQPVVSNKQFNVNGVNTILLNEPFIPFTEIVQDGYGNQYKLALTKTPHVPGTYSIEPNSGRIKINPMGETTTVFITYRKAQQEKKPCGVLCNRLLTFANPNDIASQLDANIISDDNSLFSFCSDTTKKYLLLPKLSSQMHFSQVLYNTPNENMFVSARLEMQSNNKYITPMVENIFISVK